LLDEDTILDLPDLATSLENFDVLARDYTVALVFAVFPAILLGNPDTKNVLLFEVVSLPTGLRASAEVFMDTEAASHLTILALSGLSLTGSNLLLGEGLRTLGEANAEKRSTESGKLSDIVRGKDFAHTFIS
jgi:hypothetical protein